MLRGQDGALVPGMEDGLRGMALIETAVRASAKGAGWVDFTIKGNKHEDHQGPRHLSGAISG
jgi:hypothetical protein